MGVLWCLKVSQYTLLEQKSVHFRAMDSPHSCEALHSSLMLSFHWCFIIGHCQWSYLGGYACSSNQNDPSCPIRKPKTDSRRHHWPAGGLHLWSGEYFYTLALRIMGLALAWSIHRLAFGMIPKYTCILISFFQNRTSMKFFRRVWTGVLQSPEKSLFHDIFGGFRGELEFILLSQWFSNSWGDFEPL